MVHTYRVHKKRMASGDHEVHMDDCVWCPPDDQLETVGQFESSEQAMESAKKIFSDANGCHCCMPEHYHLP